MLTRLKALNPRFSTSHLRRAEKFTQNMTVIRSIFDCAVHVCDKSNSNCYAFDSLGAQYQKETHAPDIDDYGSTDLEDYGILISAFH